jgi:hypothetical protein
MALPGYDNLHVYYGDLHNHCGISYGHGSLLDAYRNARLQLDFASVTPHAYWPDMPERDRRLASVVAYHQKGFRGAADSWAYLQEVTQAAHQEGEFVIFLSFEWHSIRHGDHNVYFKGSQGEIIRAADLGEMRANLRRLAGQGVECLLIPHHIGYLTGYRGICWEDFTPEFSPVVEIMSMHGLAESDDAPYPYLHTMGPRDGRGTMQHGLRLGKIFGVIGSTDHHSAHPGSYGHGRMAAWSRELSRDGIWDAIRSRRTYALTGDRIELAFSVNGQPMGSMLPPSPEREIGVSVKGGGPLDYVEVLHNNCTIHRWSAHRGEGGKAGEPVKVFLELGWGEQGDIVDWQVELEVVGGKLLAVEPRLRGRAIVAPQSVEEKSYAFSTWQRVGEGHIQLDTRTWGNPTTVTAATQGVCLEISGEENTHIKGRINDRQVQVALGELKYGSRVGYLGGFLTAAYSFHRAVPQSECVCHFALPHRRDVETRDWYYVRVCQKNGQWAWSSPIWVNGI